ncbi:uncharacterized protein [Argopecten irradians]|uniref:uncharacterized protein n=1 Tax=Argopecten irradians TaxID=31199 RepID=UPI003714B66A
MEPSKIEDLLEEISEKCLTCSVCITPYDKSQHVPMYYPCMHTSCKRCMSRQFIGIGIDGYAIRCPSCNRLFQTPSPISVFNYKENTTLSRITEFISAKKEMELCDICSDKDSELVCADCNLSLCKTCNLSVHVEEQSNHVVRYGIKRKDIQKDACKGCLRQPDIYCSTCKIFFCKICQPVLHSDKSLNRHEVIMLDNVDDKIEDSKALNHIGQLMQRVAQCVVGGIIDIVCSGIHTVWDLLPSPTLANIGVVFLLSVLAVIWIIIEDLPAYTLLKSDEVEPVNMKCRVRTKEAVRQIHNISKTEFHRTVCTFNIFQYDLRKRKKTYFVLDIVIDIEEAYAVGQTGNIVTLKYFYLNTTSDTYYQDRNTYWSVSWCSDPESELAICLNDHVVSAMKTEPVVQYMISTVRIRKKKRVPFLFMIDNNRHVMEISSAITLWKDVISLKHDDEEKRLSVWVSVTDSDNDEHVTVRIRGGGDIAIGDLPNPTMVTNYETIKGLVLYPLRSCCPFEWF